MAEKKLQGYHLADKLNVSTFLIDGTEVTASAAELNAMDGITSTVAELNLVDAQVASASTLTVGAEAGNAITVAIQLKDANSADLAVRSSLFAYLSDDANGDSIVATAPDGGVAAGTDGVLIPVVADKAFHLVSEADGDIDVAITHAAGAKTVYLILVLPNGKLKASGAITFA